MAFSIIAHAAITKISEDVLISRDWESEKFLGNQKNTRSGKSDAIYLSDFVEAVKEEAGPNSDVIDGLQFIFLDAEYLDILKQQRDAIKARGIAASSKQTAHALRITDALSKANDLKIINNNKAAECIKILRKYVSAAVETVLKPILKTNRGQEVLQLRQCFDKLRTAFPVTAHEIKEGLEYDFSRIGMAVDYPSTLTLTTAIVQEEQRQLRALMMDNPAVLLHRVGMLANDTAIDDHHADMDAWEVAFNALVVGAPVPAPVPRLVLPFQTPLAGEILGEYNTLCRLFCSQIPNIVRPNKFGIPNHLLVEVPAAKCLLDPTVQLKSQRDLLEILRNKMESSPTCIIHPLRAIVVNKLYDPNSLLVDVVEEITTYMSKNPDSDNHVHEQLTASLAKRSGVANAAALAEIVEDGPSLLQQLHAIGANTASASASGYGGSGDLALSDAELGRKRRAELQSTPTGRFCHFWGYQNGQLQCGKEAATKYECSFKDCHNPNHQGPPHKMYSKPLPIMGGGQHL
jgi:hypothetical protein